MRKKRREERDNGLLSIYTVLLVLYRVALSVFLRLEHLQIGEGLTLLADARRVTEQQTTAERSHRWGLIRSSAFAMSPSCADSSESAVRSALSLSPVRPFSPQRLPVQAAFDRRLWRRQVVLAVAFCGRHIH